MPATGCWNPWRGTGWPRPASGSCSPTPSTGRTAGRMRPMSPDVLPLRPAETRGPAPGHQPDPSDLARLIDRDELARRVSVGVSTLDRLRAAGKVGPRPVRV